MTKLEDFDIALRLAGYNFPKDVVDLIIQLYELTKRKHGDATIKDVTKVIEENRRKWKEKK